MSKFSNALGLDVGSARIGVARVNYIARLPEALVVLQNDETVTQKISELIKEYDIDLIVVGIPRNMNGETTQQSLDIMRFVDELIKPFGVPVEYQDETLSSVEADSRLAKSNTSIGQDAIAAQIILEYFIEAHPVQ